MANLATINNNILADSGIDPLSVVTGSGTTNQIAYWSSGTAIGSLTTATYPSLTELSYVKGVTSAIQTQINAKQNALTLTTTGSSGAATLIGATLNIPNYGSALSGYLPLAGGTMTGGITFASAPTYTPLRFTGGVADYTIAEQDGAGRVNWYWNKSGTGGAPTYQVSSEDAIRLKFSTAQAAGAESGIGVYYAPAGTAGGAITWQEIMGAFHNGFRVLPAATFTSSVTASSFIKSGGTATQILAANGSVITAGTNITISGGTISATDTGITSLNGLTALSQTFAVGTSGTDFGISSATSTHTFNLPTASATNRGALSSADWTTFNSKAPSVAGGYLPLSGGTMTGAITLPNGVVGIVVGDDATISDRNVANTMYVAGVQNTDRGYINFSETAGNQLGAINGGALTWRGANVMTTANISGTPNYIPKFTAANTIGNSIVSESGGSISVNGGINMNGTMTIQSSGVIRGYFGDVDGDNNVQLRSQSALTFKTGGNNLRATLDASGNLGLGVTPSAWSGISGKIFEIGYSGGSASIFQNGADDFWITSNAYYNAGWKYVKNGTTTAKLMSSGSHYWYTAPSGTAGNAISFTQAMTLNESGRLLLGTTTDNGTDRLQVNGNIASINSSAAGLYTISGTRSIRVQSFGGDWNYITSNGNPLVIRTEDANDFYIRTNDVNRLTIASTGAATFSSSVQSASLILAGSGYFPSKLITLGGAEFSRYNTNIGTTIVNGNSIALSFGTRSDNVDYDNTLNIWNGNVGIGTTSPVYKLQVVNSGNTLLQLNGNNTTGTLNTGFTISADDSKNIYLYQRENAATVFGTNDTERMRITSAGNVGIGTTSPNSPLQIGSSNFIITDRTSAVYGGDSENISTVGRSGVDYPQLLNFGVNQAGLYSTISARQFTVSTENKLVLQPNGGNVGIGTTSPNAILDVYTSQGGSTIAATHGTGGSYPKASGISFGATSTSLTVSNNGSTTTFFGGAGIYANNSSASNNTTDLILWTTSGGSPTERMRITSGGNLGLGVTPSAWSNIFNVIQGPQGSVIAFQNNGNSLKLGSNFYFTGANYNYINTNAATRYDADAEHRWYTAPSGTAGTTITFTQAMTLNASGRLLLGTTTDNGADRLQISGNGLFSNGRIVINQNSTSSSALQVNSNDIVTYTGNLIQGTTLVVGGSGFNLIDLSTNGTVRFRVNGLGEGTFSNGLNYNVLKPSTTNTASTATLTPNLSLGDTFTITAQAVALAVASPTGTFVNGQKLLIRIKDNGTARAITWTTGASGAYRASSDLALPTTTIINRTMYLGFIWNSTDSRWDLIAFLNNFA